ncbi:hypothetical protein E6O75_ATG05109 [Venturia nashicola]|uniref:Uncharacterized protein n=1 Tax=Venturia nashicola TaxID=86259 RepID=A0A4Z1P580_9PEZI|nr:hypothetical protein E6O75_ATG05109 [Venturia nashicola]
MPWFTAQLVTAGLCDPTRAATHDSAGDRPSYCAATHDSDEPSYRAEKQTSTGTGQAYDTKRLVPTLANGEFDCNSMPLAS